MTTQPHSKPHAPSSGHAGTQPLQKTMATTDRSSPVEQPLLVVGGGNMASAILRGGIAGGVIDPARVFVIEPDQSKLAALRTLGIQVSPIASEGTAWLKSFDDRRDAAISSAAQVVLCVKPQMLQQAAVDIRAAFRDSRIVVSILAGTPSAIIRRALGESARVVRAMPNLAASIAHSATAVCLGDGACDGDDTAACRIFGSVGPIVVRLDESRFDAFTALAGSGPAYLFYLAQGMIEGAVRAGLSPEQSRNATIQTLLGAAMLLARSDESPETLRAAVTSKGGTTAAAIAVLDQRETLTAIADAIIAGTARGAELARLADKQTGA